MSRRSIYNYKIYLPLDPNILAKDFDPANYKVVFQDETTAPFDNPCVFFNILVYKHNKNTENSYISPNCVVGISVDGGKEQYYRLELSFSFKPIIHI